MIPVVYLLLVLFAAGFTVLLCYCRYRYDKRIITRDITEQGGTVEQFRIRMRPVRSEYEVTYIDKEGKRRFGKCRTCVSNIYWAVNKEIGDPEQRFQRDAEDRAR